MNIIINIAIGVLYLASLLSISFLFLREKSKTIELAMYAAELATQKDLLLMKIDAQDKEISALQSEDFIGFLTKSREFAFEYIEKTQAALLKFKEAVEPTIAYHDTYGRVLGETHDWQNMEVVSKAYAELLEILPKENEIPNN